MPISYFVETSIYLKRSSLHKESSFSYFFFFSVGWLCLAKLDESSKFGCFLPALLLLPFPICTPPTTTYYSQNKKSPCSQENFLICFFIPLMSNMPSMPCRPCCSGSTACTSGPTIPYLLLLLLRVTVMLMVTMVLRMTMMLCLI